VEESRLGLWARRISIAVALGLIMALMIGAYRGSSVIADQLLVPTPPPAGEASEILLVGAGRIVLPRNELTERTGVWGVSNGGDGYGQMTGVISQDADTIERSFRTLTGRFIAGDMVTFDAYATATDPMEAHAIDFDEVRVPGPLGVNPAWWIDGSLDTCVVIIHGEGLDERRQSLRILPTLVDAGFPVLVVTYRNDGAAPDAGGYYRWGLSEWHDIDAALTWAQGSRGVDDFVLLGYGMGATMAMMHLHESDLAADVLGAVLDSPVLDLGAVVDSIAAERGIPGIVDGAAKAVARVRFGMEWADLDQTSRIDEFDTPLLLLQGTEDDVASVATADEFAAALPEVVTYVRFEGAGRTELWNHDPERYDEAVLLFVSSVVGENQ
jgi:pimeloyl-ACP methyl ester carboxylesterase